MSSTWPVPAEQFPPAAHSHIGISPALLYTSTPEISSSIGPTSVPSDRHLPLSICSSTRVGYATRRLDEWRGALGRQAVREKGLCIATPIRVSQLWGVLLADSRDPFLPSRFYSESQKDGSQVDHMSFRPMMADVWSKVEVCGVPFQGLSPAPTQPCNTALHPDHSTSKVCKFSLTAHHCPTLFC